MTHLRRLPFPMIALLLATALRASPLDEANKQAQAADAKVATTATSLTKIGRLIAAQQEAMNKLLRMTDDVRDREQRLLPLVDEMIRVSDLGMTAAKDELTISDREVDRSTKAHAAAKNRVGEAWRAAESAIDAERQRFQTAEAYVKANENVSQRETILQQIRTALESDAADNTLLKTAKAAVADAESRVNELRAAIPQNEAALSSASDAWIKAKNALEQTRANLFANDPSHRNALDSLREAQRTLTAMDAKFQAELDALPSIVATRGAHKWAVEDLADRNAAMEAAKEARDRASRESERRTSELMLIRKVRIEAQFDLKAIDLQAKAIQNDLRATNQQLGDSIDNLNGVRKLLKSAMEAIRNIGNKQDK